MQQFVDSCAIFAGAIVDEVEIRRNAETEILGKLMADISDCVVQSCDALLLLAFIALDGDVDPHRLSARGHQDFVDGYQANPRIGKLSGNNDDEFFLDRLNEAVFMMLCTTVFQERYSCKESGIARASKFDNG